MHLRGTDTLGEFCLTPEEIAGDYFEGESAYQQYLELLEGADRDMTAADYAKSTGISRSSHPKEYNTRYEFMNRFLQGRYHAAIQALISLRALGVLEGDESRYFDPRLLQSFDMHNRRFELLAMLSAFGFWTGSINQTGPRASPNRTSKDFTLVHRDIADKEAVDIVDQFIERLKNDGICTSFKAEASKRDGRVVAPITRLIVLMNGMLGRKSQTDHAFPEIFERAFQSLNVVASRDECKKSSRILRDFILAFFVIRATFRPEHGYSGWIVAHEDKKIADQRRNLFRAMLIKSGFDNLPVQLSPEKNRYDKNRKYSYVTRVTFPRIEQQTVDDIRKEFRCRIHEVLL